MFILHLSHNLITVMTHFRSLFSMLKMNNVSSPIFPVMENTNDMIFLKTICIITGLIIVNSNSYLLWKIWYKKKITRANLILIVLCITDFAVGLVSVPIFLMDVFSAGYNECLISCNVMKFFDYFPFCYAWLLTIFLAVDRCLLVTKQKLYEDTITKRVVIKVLLALFALSVTVSFYTTFQKTSLGFWIVHFVIEILSILAFIICYTYIFIFVKSKSNAIKSSKHCKFQTKKRLSRTITYMFLCQVFLTSPRYVVLCLAIYADVSLIVSLKAIFWAYIITYSHCYANCFIIITNLNGSF